jgi:putative ABC transport system permease protein
MVAVISNKLASEVADTPELAIGEVLSPSWGDVRIVGVLAEAGIVSMRLMMVPYGVAGSRLETDDITSSLVVRVDQVEDTGRIRDAIDVWVKLRFADRAEDISVSSNESRVEQATRAMLVFKLIMGAIAGISLIVGGVGIMNVLLASVSERTREIGIRKATGARAVDIRIQFLAESLAISGLGCAIGLMVGMGVAMTLARIVRQITEAPLQAAFTWPSLLIAVGASLLTGLVFGTWPARRAARLSPIEALRDE